MHNLKRKRQFNLVYHYRYEQKLAKTERLGMRKGLAVGISYGIELFLLLLMYASVFW